VLTILALVAERHNVTLSGTRIRVLKEMISTPIRRIGRLETTVTIPPGAVEDLEMRQRLETAARKCPVHQSLHPEIDAPIQFIYE
jgi:putative redox protein